MSKPLNSASVVAIARHETFHVRDGWLVKGMRAVQEDGQALARPESHHRLGVGKNMLAAIRYWCQATQLVRPAGTVSRLELTSLGRTLLDLDPFLEDPATLWIIHHRLASNRRQATFWYWVFNELDAEEIGEESAVLGFRQWLQRMYPDAASVSDHSIRKDWACFVRTYLPSKGADIWDEIQCPLAILGLAERSSFRGVRLRSGRKVELDPLVFAWACAQFLESTATGSAIASFDELRWRPLSPGRLLCLDMRALIESIDRLVDMRFARVAGTAGLRTIHFSLPEADALVSDALSSQRIAS